MRRPQLRNGRTSRIFAVAALVCALVTVLPLRSVFDVANGYIAGALLRHDGNGRENIVVVAWDGPNAPTQVELDDLIAVLTEAGAVKVVPVLHAMPEDFSATAASDPRVTLVVPQAAVPPEATLSGQPITLHYDRELAFSYYRATGTGTASGERPLPWFDQTILGNETHVPNRYWLSYPTERELMPIYDWGSVIEGTLPERAFGGKVVVVALAAADVAVPPDLRSGLVASAVPPASFVANTLQALSGGRVAVALPFWLTLGVMFLASVEAGVILGRLRDRAGPWILPLCLAVIGAAGGGVLLVTGVMFPLAETFTTFTAAWSMHRTIVDVNRRRRQSRQLRRLALVASPSRRALPETPERWAEQVTDTARGLQLTRWAYYRHSYPRGYRVAAVSEDPFPDKALSAMRGLASGLDRGGQMRALTPVPASVSEIDESREESWAVMLRSEGARASVWIVVCPKGWFSNSPARRATLISTAEQLHATAPKARSLRSQPTLDEEIWERARGLGEDAGTLDLLTRLASSAFAIYDLTGRLIRQNERMRSVSDGAHLGLQDLSLLDAIGGLTKLGREEANGILSELISSGEPQRMRLAEPIDHRHYDFRLSLFTQDPVIADRQGRFGAILCELLDVTPSVRLSQARENVTDFFDQQLRNDFEAVDLIVGMLTDDTLDDGVRKAVAGRLAKVKERMLDRMRDFETALKDAARAETGQAVPTEMRRALDGAIDSMMPQVSARRLELDYDPPALLSLAFASAENLETVFRDALEVCLADAREGGRIRVAVTETPNSIETLIEAEGYGLPAEILAEIESGETAHVPGDLRRVRQGATAVEAWGGTFMLASELDRGVASKITLRKVR